MAAPTPPRAHRRHWRFLGPSGEATTGLSDLEEQSEGRGKELPSGSEGTKRDVPF